MVLFHLVSWDGLQALVARAVLRCPSFPTEISPRISVHGSGFKGGLIIELDVGESVFQPDFQSSAFRFGQICLGSKQVNKQ